MSKSKYIKPEFSIESLRSDIIITSDPTASGGDTNGEAIIVPDKDYEDEQLG